MIGLYRQTSRETTDKIHRQIPRVAATDRQTEILSDRQQDDRRTKRDRQTQTDRQRHRERERRG